MTKSFVPVAFALALFSWVTLALGQDDRVLLEAGAASFRVPARFLLLDYREGGVDEPIPVKWFGINFWLNDRTPVAKDEKRPNDVAIQLVGIEAKPAHRQDDRFLPANQIWATVSAPLLFDYTKTEEFGLEKHEYCGLDAIGMECPTTYISKFGTSPQLYARGRSERMPSRDRPFNLHVYYPEDHIVYWLTLPESVLPRWKAATDGAIGLLRSWRVP